MRWLAFVLARLPRSLLAALGAFLGWLAWTLRIRRRIALDNLRLAFPEKPEAERRALARANYAHLGRLVPEFLRAPAMTRGEVERLFDYENWGALTSGLEAGTGVIVCTAHFGNFEVLAAAHAMKGVPLTVITRRMGKSKANDAWRARRASSGVDELVAAKGQTLSAAIRALKQNRVLAYVFDQNQPRRRAVFPTFFGVPAATAPTPAVLALRTGAPVVFALGVPLPDGRVRVVVEGPLRPPSTGDRDADVLAFMQDLNDRLERWVRKYPERWYWIHRRWKTRPDGEPAPAAAGPA